MILLQLAVVLFFIFLGARLSGIGLGVMGMVGLLILLFVFKLQPSNPPLEVMLIILSVVTAAAALQASGGMDFLVDVAGKILRSRPGQITLFRPYSHIFICDVCRHCPYLIFYSANYRRSGNQKQDTP